MSKIISIGYLTFLLFTTSVTLEAKTFSYWQVHHMPRSIEKDYYIWRFLEQKTTTTLEARTIIKEIFHLNKKLRLSYKAKTGFDAPVVKVKKGNISEKVWKGTQRANAYFLNGLKLLQKNNKKLAISYFKTAEKNYTKRYEKDKVLFWLYMTTQKRKYLNALHKSYHPNIYTLIAADTIQGKYPKTITQQIRKNHVIGFDIKDPISWSKIKTKMNHSSSYSIDSLARHYASQETIGIYTYLKARASNFTKSYFPMPYRGIMKHLPIKKQALIYAIARQESRFVPASVSSSFALGMMQFMPFLIKDIAKRKKESIDLDAIFDPKKSIEYADFHLKFLMKFLKHPLFIAYAYNAGIGFTKKYLKSSHHFRKGSYEPYMSIETMQNAQAREYGKKVLANYIIYMNKLGKPTRIFSLLKVLATPQKTDTFRH